MTYDDGNIFARILRGESPCHKIFEDEATFAFLDIMPRANGHALVLPKAETVNIFDVDQETLCTLIGTVRFLAPFVRDAMEADAMLIQQFNEAAAGQTVFHIHFHMIPRWDGVALKPHTGEMEDPDVLAANAEKIRATLEGA